MKKVVVNSARSQCRFNIDVVEEKYNAKFVGMLPLKSSSHGWDNTPSAIFYQAVPPVEGYSHYFALIVREAGAFITSGQSAVDGVITGIIADDEEIIYSTCRHDYRTSTDGSVFIDGGRDYVRTAAFARLITMKIVDGEFYQLLDEQNA